MWGTLQAGCEVTERSVPRPVQRGLRLACLSRPESAALLGLSRPWPWPAALVLHSLPRGTCLAATRAQHQHATVLSQSSYLRRKHFDPGSREDRRVAPLALSAVACRRCNFPSNATPAHCLGPFFGNPVTCLPRRPGDLQSKAP
jgi:hypothetical protein